VADRVVPGEAGRLGFVGRAEELALLAGALERARDGRPSVVVVGGEAGIGKSDLLAEAARRSNVPLVVGRCVPVGGDAMPLAPLADLVRHVRRRHPELLALPAAAPVEAWASSTSSSPVSLGALAGGVLELIGAAAGVGPAIVAFEDLHWADASTWDLVDFLARNLEDEHVVVAATCRTDEVAAQPANRRRLAELVRLPGVQRVDLTGLSGGEVAASVEVALGRAPDPGLVDELLARGQGNPFFTRELLAARSSGQAIPPVLSDLIGADLAQLDPGARAVVAALATIGQDADDAFLLPVVDHHQAALEEGLRAAVAVGAVVVDGDRYRLRHALIGEVAYAELLPPERARLHRRIADVLAALPPEVLRRPDRAGELAFHLDRAGDVVAAFRARLVAADLAESMAPAVAVAHLERALALWDEAGDAAAGEDRVARLWQAADLSSATVSNQRSIDLARQALLLGVPPRGAAWAHERLGRFLWADGRLEASEVEFEQAARLLPDVPTPADAATRAGLAQSALMAGRPSEAARRVAEVLAAVPEPAADPAAWVMAARVRGVVLSQQGDPEAGIGWCRAAVEHAPTVQMRTLALAYLGIVLLDAGRYRDAAAEMLDAAAEGQRTGTERSFGAFLDGIAAEALIRSGLWPSARVVLDRRVPDRRVPIGANRFAAAGVLLAGRRGDPAAVEACLANAAEEGADPFQQLMLQHAVCDAAVACGRWDEAVDVARRAGSTELGRLPLWQARFAALAVPAVVEQALDAVARREPIDLAGVRARLDAELAGIRWPGDVPLVARAELAHAGATLTRLGAPDPDAWSAAVAAWSAVGDTFRVATCRLLRVESLVAVGDMAAAADELQQAHSLAVELGASRLVGEAEALSRRTRLSLETASAPVLERGAVERLGLTAREVEVLQLVASGRTNRQIGEELYVSEKTASVHVSNILRKLGVSSRVDAAAVAQRLGVAE